MKLLAIVALLVALYLVLIAGGYYVGLGYIEDMIDIEPDSSDAEFPPGFGGRESERLGPLSPEEIDEIDDWDRWK